MQKVKRKWWRAGAILFFTLNLVNMSLAVHYERLYTVSDYHYPVAETKGKNVGMLFKHVIVPLDGEAYDQCHFDHVIFVWSGHSPIALMNSEFIGDNALMTPELERILEPYLYNWTDPNDPNAKPRLAPPAQQPKDKDDEPPYDTPEGAPYPPKSGPQEVRNG